MKIHWILKNDVATVSELRHAIEISHDGIIGIGLSSIIEKLPEALLKDWIANADIVHSGLCSAKSDSFNSVQLCTFNWHFLNPSSDRPSVSWKATTDFVLFDKQLISKIGTIDEQFLHPDAALMDWVYRAMVAGAKTIHQPLPLELWSMMDKSTVSISDEMLFVCKHFNKKAQAFYRFCQLFLTGKWLTVPNLAAKNQFISKENESFKLTNTSQVISIDSYAALIPTIDRYDYIGASIRSLLALPLPPTEIVVVDQTPIEKRRPEIYDSFVKAGIVKLIFLDKAGQSTARNRGLAAITQRWVLLFEDDSEAWPEMVTEHIALIKKSGCDVSTGVIVPPGADQNFIPERNRKYFLAEIFTTGNAFMKVETAMEVGGLDPAFDHGPGADDDFGKRLYKAGKIIVYNYKSIETHYKAPQGGMRVHGIWWRNKSTLFGPYPPVTQSFLILKYYPSQYHLFLFLNMILKARKKYSFGSYFVFLFLLPYKLFTSVKQAGKLIKKEI